MQLYHCCDSILLLTVVLNIVLYSPLLTIIEERKEYILTNLGKASEILAEANKLHNTKKN
jgi:F0F1-type ATP synthase membrane subunit b/b'